MKPHLFFFFSNVSVMNINFQIGPKNFEFDVSKTLVVAGCIVRTLRWQGAQFKDIEVAGRGRIVALRNKAIFS